MTIEFVLMFPLFLAVLLAGIELAVIQIRQASLERAVDIAVRQVRLSTGDAPQHDEIKNLICDLGAMIYECQTNLKLEMIKIDPSNVVFLSQTPDCTDQSEEAKPARNFVNGQQNEIMVLRACAKFTPFFPSSGIGQQLEQDGAGAVAFTATTFFVQEPD